MPFKYLIPGLYHLARNALSYNYGDNMGSISSSQARSLGRLAGLGYGAYYLGRTFGRTSTSSSSSSAMPTRARRFIGGGLAQPFYQKNFGRSRNYPRYRKSKYRRYRRRIRK